MIGGCGKTVEYFWEMGKAVIFEGVRGDFCVGEKVNWLR